MGSLATNQDTASEQGGVVKLPWYAIKSCCNDRTISFILKPVDTPLIWIVDPTSRNWSRFFRKPIWSASETCEGGNWLAIKLRYHITLQRTSNRNPSTDRPSLKLVASATLSYLVFLNRTCISIADARLLIVCSEPSLFLSPQWKWSCSNWYLDFNGPPDNNGTLSSGYFIEYWTGGDKRR